MAMPLVQQRIEAMVLYRSDDRDLPDIEDAGGFVPIYLLKHHEGGFEGFLNCQNKKPGIMGCGCPGMYYGAFWVRARAEFNKLICDPTLVQTHVINNSEGYVSTSFKAEDEEISANHRYKINVNFDIQGPVEDVRRELGLVGLPRVLPIYRKIEFYLTLNYFMIAVAPLYATGAGEKWELTFLTPIPSRFITKVR